MRITRRQFASAVGSTIALTVLGCSEDSGDGSASAPSRRNKLVLPDGPFTVGHPEKYRSAGVYRNYRQSHGIWLVSDGSQLVALSAVCTHNGCGTRYDTTSRIFKCPCHKSMFSTEGLNKKGSKAERPLERCRIALIGKPDEASAELQVDPTTRYRQEIDNPMSGRNWASPHSVYIFEQAEG